ncbi:isochorismatase family protein [Jannaschia aquimarina]|uniref:Isochorismatase family protein n=1 Tax=Jannaschia aquimarina TaxID=935700 RepID=A0A0D1CK87_9RHOB|nr:isochorismatase family protein [Jannaschia aquimarina]KIT15162.1 Isochorismatase family protein [Jannaschia aquimarina]SNT43194.1 Nicotinamidase-related amidase [Jannaschia aquimarina]
MPFPLPIRLRAAMLAVAATMLAATAFAQDASAPAPAPAPAMEVGQRLLDRDDTVFLMLDHQAGLMQIVNDIDPTQLRRNVAAKGMVAEFFGIPVIASTSVPEGPNGPLIPEVTENAPSATVIDRAGPINAWDDERIREAVEATGRNTIVISGILTSVCVAFPAIEMAAEGYHVIAAIDASGDYSDLASQTTIARLQQAGVVVESTFSILSQVHDTWDEQNTPVMAEAYSLVTPEYGAVLESYFATVQATN